MGLENIAPYTLKHFEAQPAAAWQSFIIWSTGIPSSSQQSGADATTSSEAVTSSFGTAKAPAIGSSASDIATKKVSMIRPVRMQCSRRLDYRSAQLLGQVTISRAVLGI